MKKRITIIILIVLTGALASWLLRDAPDPTVDDSPNATRRTFTSNNLNFTYELPLSWEVVNDDQNDFTNIAVQERQVILLVRSQTHEGVNGGEEHISTSFMVYGNPQSTFEEWYRIHRAEDVSQFGNPFEENITDHKKEILFHQNRIDAFNVIIGEETVRVSYFPVGNRVMQIKTSGSTDIYEIEKANVGSLLDGIVIVGQ